MIYLKNNTILQDVYIPRQDMLQYTTGSSGTYAEGYADGYESGETHQKNLLVTTAFTENGEYTRENGWSGVTVNVPTGRTYTFEGKTVVISADTTNILPSSGIDAMTAVTVDASEYAQQNYDDGFDDGFDDGYASGSTEEREKLSAVTFTANTAVTMDEGGYSAVTVNVAQTGHTDQELEDAYTSGHTDGMDDQKQLLTTTAFTQNGNYTRENGWSGVTVNIDTASTYQSGYTSGHTDGVSEEKAKLSATTFTANTAVTLNDGGYSAITVNVPQTGSSANIEPNKPFTATSNGSYTITPTSASTTVTDRFDSDTDRYYITATTSGYPSTGHFELFYIEDEFDSSKGQIDVYIENGYLDYDDSDWYGGEIVDLSLSTNIDLFIRNANRDFGWSSLEYFNYHYDAMSAVTLNVNVPTGSSAVLGVGSFSANGTYSASTDNLDGYSALTVNVPTSVETEIVMVTTGWCWFDTNYTMHYGDSIEIEHCTFGKSGIVRGRHQQYVGGNQSEVFRIGENENYLYLKYFNNFSSAGGVMHLPSSGSLIEDKTINFSSTGFVIDGNVITSYTTTELASTAQLVFFADTDSGNDSITGQTAKMGVVRIYGSDGTLKATFKPMLDEFNVPFFKYVEEDIDIYAIGSGTPSYEIIDPSYVSGYTNGYTDGQNNIISTFTATTATTNGVYGSSANPLSSITVNVPQIGGVYGTKTITANGTYSASTDNFDGYSAITVNVPSSGERDIIICSSGQCWFDFDYTMVYGDYIDIEHCTFGKIGSHSGSSSHQQLIGGGTGEWFRIGQPNDNTIYFKYFNQNVYESTFSNDPFLNDNHLVFSKDAITIDGNVFTSYTTTDRSYEPIIKVFANTNGGNDKIKNQTAKVGTIRVYGVDGTLKATFKPMLDEFNVPFFKYVEEDINIYALGSGTPTYEFLPSSDYVSGYTDGYNSGYTSGYTDGYDSGFTAGEENVENNAQTLSVSANGTYNTGLRTEGYLWNEVIVNVPQTGSPATLGIKSFSANGAYSASTDNLDGYSAITISVPQTHNLTPDDVAQHNFGFVNPIINVDVMIYACQFSNITGNVTIGDSSTTIGSYAFGNCYGLTSAVITGNVTTIGNNAFGNCMNMTSVTISDNVTTIGHYAFDNTGLKSIVIPSGVTSLGSYAFGQCPLTALTLGQSLTSIPMACFLLTQLKSVTIPDNIQSIGAEAFQQCYKLTGVTFGTGVTYIDRQVFESCSGLTNVRFYSTTEPQLGIAPFNNIKSSGNGYYPNGSDYSNVIAAFPSGWTWHTF